jgi:hypothetical protein
MQTLVVFLVAAHLLLIALAVPMIRGKVKPNGLYGFRIPLTLDNPQIWYPANRYAGWLLLAWALISLVATLGLPFLPGMDLDRYAVWLLVFDLVGLAVVFLLSWRYARRLAQQDD